MTKNTAANYTDLYLPPVKEGSYITDCHVITRPDGPTLIYSSDKETIIKFDRYLLVPLE